MRAFAISVGVSLAMVLLFETELLPTGLLAGRDGSDEFVVATFMELLTLCAIPVALRLFKFRSVAGQLTGADGLLHWGLVRMAMLCLPMVANTLLHYLYMNVAFGYMGIILFLCIAFVLPTKARCEAEIQQHDAQKEH